MRVGLYPGTFDPVTNGHLDIIRRGCTLVDRLVIGVAINRDKGPLFSLEERVAMIEAECVPLGAAVGCEVVVHPFENLLINCARDVGAGMIIRGLRAVADFEYEFQMGPLSDLNGPFVILFWVFTGTWPLPRLCRSSGWRSPIHCHTMQGYAPCCRPAPWSGQGGRSMNADRG